ncbi:MAG: orotidine-5'-phosphate decarboxylase [Enterobacterales bacterium]|nr:orotidine-5'-phosphate decarboxylase [Enterobacterales bacterium]
MSKQNVLCKKPIIVALDFDSLTEARALVKKLDPRLCRVKVGKEMFTLFGPDWVKELLDQQFEVFLDLKFHDIPNTVAKACVAAASLGVWMVNLHASGGAKMMLAAKQALDHCAQPPLLTAVTLLTSMDSQEYQRLGYQRTLGDQVMHYASMAKDCGLDGVVCSAWEAQALSAALGNDFKLVTPGIRPKNYQKDDQSRIMTPSQAIAAGSSYLVIGRPITSVRDPLGSLCEISENLVSH